MSAHTPGGADSKEQMVQRAVEALGEAWEEAFHDLPPQKFLNGLALAVLTAVKYEELREAAEHARQVIEGMTRGVTQASRLRVKPTTPPPMTSAPPWWRWWRH